MRLKIVFLVVAAPLMSACPSAPEMCGKNVAYVNLLNFGGPAVLELREGDEHAFSGYEVIAAITKQQADSAATMCYAVRDVDPWWKLFWGVDDVLDANYIQFTETPTDARLPEHFVLEERDGEVCGYGSIPGTNRVRGCSGEDEAEVYLDVFGSDGEDSPVRIIRVP